MLMNIHTMQWDTEIIRELNIPIEGLPQIYPSSASFGLVESSNPKLSSYAYVPIHGVLGDQQAALFGQTCFSEGEIKCTYGTGAFLLMNVGAVPRVSTKGLLTTIAYQLDGSDPIYALEGSIAYCGSVIQWLRDNLQIIQTLRESEQIASSVADNGGVYFVPAFAGLFAPFWREDARGTIVGLTAFNTSAHLVRAALEASAFQIREVIHAMQIDAPGVAILSMKVDGGMTENNIVMQFQSDLTDIPMIAPKVTETTALGAAFIAGLGVGIWKDIGELRSLSQTGKSWNPMMNENDRATQVINFIPVLLHVTLIF